MELKTRGYVLFSRPYAESDRIATLFTLQSGRVSALVKGVRKAGSKLAHALESMCESDLVLHKKGSSDLYRLTQAKLRDGNAGLKKELPSIAALQVLADILSQAYPEGEAHPEAYGRVQRFLAVLGSVRDGAERERLLASFALKALEELGYPAELSRCAECGASLARVTAALLPHRGGALCPACMKGEARLRLKPAERSLAEKLREWPFERCKVLKASPRASRELFRAVLGYLEETLEHPLKTLSYYQQMAPEPGTGAGNRTGEPA